MENSNEKVGESCVISRGWRMQKNLLVSSPSPSLSPLSLHPFYKEFLLTVSSNIKMSINN